MENILLNRTKLISALDKIDPEEFYSDAFEVIKNKIIIPIKQNKLNDYLIADDELEKVSFCKGLDSIHNRTKMTIGRYVRRNLDVQYQSLRDGDLNLFAKLLNIQLLSLEQIEKNITFLTGDDIIDFYKNHDSDIHSCMTGHDSYKTRLYALNPDKVSLAVYDNKSRALLWTTDDSNKILDRIYPDDGCFTSFLLEHWAKLKGYKNYDEMEDVSKRFYISLKHDDDVFPYLDTFCHGKKSKKIIKLCNNYFYKQNVLLRCTNGELGNIDICMFCEKTNIHSDFIYYGATTFSKHKFICQKCYSKHTVICDYCHRNSIRNNVYKRGNNKICLICLKQQAKPCTNCGEKLIKSYSKINVNGFDCYLCDNCSMNYYTCSKCNTIRDEEKYPKTIKRNRFYCPDC
jgi:hypothetical protein